MSGLSSSLWIVGSYIVAGVVFYLGINFLTKGFIGQYLKVKMSRGRLVLVKCYDITDTFYKAGKFDTRKNLVVKDRQKKAHTFSKVDKSYIGRELGMNVIEVDLIKGIIIKKDFSTATGYDLTMVDDIVNRALMLPKLNKDDVWETAEKIILIVILVGIGVAVYLLLTQQGASCNCSIPAGVNI